MAAGSKEECSKRGPGSGVMAIYDLALPSCHVYHTRLVKEVDTKLCPGLRGGDLDSSSVQGCQIHSEKEHVGWESVTAALAEYNLLHPHWHVPSRGRVLVQVVYCCVPNT